MSSVVIKVHPFLRQFIGGHRKMIVDGVNLRQAIDSIEVQYPGFKKRVLKDAREIGFRAFFYIYIDEEDMRSLENLDTPLENGDKIVILLPIPDDGETMRNSRDRLRLTFEKDKVAEPAVCQMAKQFDVVFSIRRANIETDAGWMDLELSGDDLEIDRAIEYLENLGVRVTPAGGDVMVG